MEAGEMKECPNCKESLYDDARVCIYCGWDFKSEQVNPFRKDFELRKLNNRYEYKVVKVMRDYDGTSPVEFIEMELTRLAKDGWRLHTVYSDTSKAYKQYGFEDSSSAIREEYITDRETILIMERLVRFGKLYNKEQ